MIGDVVLKLEGPAHDEVRRLFDEAYEAFNTIQHLSRAMAEAERRAWRAIRELAPDRVRTGERVYVYDRKSGSVVDAGPADAKRFLAQDEPA